MILLCFLQSFYSIVHNNMFKNYKLDKDHWPDCTKKRQTELMTSSSERRNAVLSSIQYEPQYTIWGRIWKNNENIILSCFCKQSVALHWFYEFFRYAKNFSSYEKNTM